MCAVVALLLWGYVIYHCYLIRIGFTTNESVKHAHYSIYLEDTVKLFSDWERLRLEDPKANPP